MAASTSTSSPEVLHLPVVVVGGGMGGLYTAHQLLNKYNFKSEDIVVLEARRGVGGRLVTTTHDVTNGQTPEVKFNDFAWRIGETNTMMLQLAKDFGVELVEQFTPPADASKKESHEFDTKPRTENKAPLSTYSAAALESTTLADLQDRESGYAGRTAQIAFPGESHGSKHWFAPKGLNAFPRAVLETLPEGMVKTYHRAADVEKQEDGTYKVTVMHSHGYDFTEKHYICEQVVLAVPPFQARTFSVAKDMQPALFAVYERRLGHIYVQCKPGTVKVPDASTGPDRIYKMIPDNILQQIVSGDYGHNVFQAGYACDRFERVWRELQFQGNDVVNQEVRKQLAKISGVDPALGDQIEQAFVRILFVHRWQVEAHVNGKTKEELSLQAITPNPVRLPGLYLVGEAFSSQQGWTEGAVMTASKAAEFIGQHKSERNVMVPEGVSPYNMPCKVDETSMVYRDLVLEASTFAGIHPGGAGPINWMKGHDVTNMFENYHKGWPNPLATIFGIQKGSLKQDD
ncbi:amine oxidase [Seminavis robusta]|uniref:monoamine oxidase n=1 Tax=Seminavis robusta TaxID=568900 RepID=A0A9N8DE75_9STRA|nr:amine oxidase [Seminavis robusta]|eukprot:Sro31_g020070.1 amine oxidase (515) ;mRNA; f:22540-24162